MGELFPRSIWKHFYLHTIHWVEWQTCFILNKHHLTELVTSPSTDLSTTLLMPCISLKPLTRIVLQATRASHIWTGRTDFCKNMQA